MTEECQELKNIKYQTMLLNNNSKIVSSKENSINLEELLEREKNNNKNKPWSKLGRSLKMKKITEFVDYFAEENKITAAEKTQLHKYLNYSLDRKKLQRVKDVIYDTKNERIKSIPGLTFNKQKQKFTLRRTDRKKSTLKGLAPKRKKNKN